MLKILKSFSSLIQAQQCILWQKSTTILLALMSLIFCLPRETEVFSLFIIILLSKTYET